MKTRNYLLLIPALIFSLTIGACNDTNKQDEDGSGGDKKEQKSGPDAKQGENEQEERASTPENPYEGCKPTAIIRGGKTYPIKWKGDKPVLFIDTEFKYNDEGKVSEIGNYWTFKYNEDGKIKSKTQKGAVEPMVTNYIYMEGTLIERKETLTEAGKTMVTIISTDQDGRITKEVYKNPNGQVMRTVEYAYDEKGNLINTKIKSEGKLRLEIDYSYDNYPNIAALTNPKPAPEPEYAKSQNNIVKITETRYGQDGKVKSTQTDKFNYTYDEGRVVKVENDGQVEEYLYGNCE